jgi:PAP_fibrillin
MVLDIVRSLETKSPPSKALLTDPKEAQILDGVWYLHYTSPSDPSLIDDGVSDNSPDVWKPQKVEEKITTTQFKAKGSVNAAGIEVDTSNRVVKQTLHVQKRFVANEIDLDFGNVVVGGPFRPSDNVPCRAVVSFQKCDITLKNGFTFKLGFLFRLLALARGTNESGWLETTFIDSDMRIGRGNKGTRRNRGVLVNSRVPYSSVCTLTDDYLTGRPGTFHRLLLPIRNHVCVNQKRRRCEAINLHCTNTLKYSGSSTTLAELI